MLYADEVVDEGSLEGLSARGAPHGRELAMAEQLIDALAGPFEPDKYKDDYRKRVQALLKRKAEGKEIVMPPTPERPAAVGDLMDALKASLESRKSGPARERAPKRARSRATPRKTAARARAHRKAA